MLQSHANLKFQNPKKTFSGWFEEKSNVYDKNVYDKNRTTEERHKMRSEERL